MFHSRSRWFHSRDRRGGLVSRLICYVCGFVVAAPNWVAMEVSHRRRWLFASATVVPRLRARTLVPVQPYL